MDQSFNEYIEKGWKLSEFLHWVTLEDKKNFFKLLGNENFIVLDEVTQNKKWKAKLLISPIGLEKLEVRLAEIHKIASPSLGNIAIALAKHKVSLRVLQEAEQNLSAALILLKELILGLQSK
jgi:hypothetical protein